MLCCSADCNSAQHRIEKFATHGSQDCVSTLISLDKRDNKKKPQVPLGALAGSRHAEAYLNGQCKILAILGQQQLLQSTAERISQTVHWLSNPAWAEGSLGSTPLPSPGCMLDMESRSAGTSFEGLIFTV